MEKAEGKKTITIKQGTGEDAIGPYFHLNTTLRMEFNLESHNRYYLMPLDLTLKRNICMADSTQNGRQLD